MVVQKTIDNLKDRPKDERKVVAGGIAITVIVVLLIGWAILFFKRIQSGSQEVNFESGVQDEFNFSSTRDAQSAIENQGGEDLSGLRDDAAATKLRGEQEIYLQDMDNSDQFGNSGF